MKQITPEIKARVFALYWGQEILAYQHGDQIITSNEIDCWALGKDKTYLEVKSLSSITDEDAIEVAKLSNLPDLGQGYNVVRDNENVFVTNAKHPNNYLNGFRCINDTYYYPCVDYLRSKSYALPAFGYSVNELVEAGVFKLKEEEQ